MRTEIENWDGMENAVMKGYLLIAFRRWNEAYPEESISPETLGNLLNALTWATDDYTAEEAYRYYSTH